MPHLPYVLQEVVRPLRVLAACGMLCVTMAMAAAPAALDRADAAAGHAKADNERCTECHVPHDPTTAQPDGALHALLAGQSADYLAKQMRDFRSGAREHAVMTVISRNLDDGDLADILAWYASQPWRAGANAAPDVAVQRLYTEGDPARGIVACVTCHGGLGQPPAAGDMPRIAGQDAAYLATQLQYWRNGYRSNSAGGVMSVFARPLTNIEIQALATSIAAMK